MIYDERDCQVKKYGSLQRVSQAHLLLPRRVDLITTLVLDGESLQDRCCNAENFHVWRLKERDVEETERGDGEMRRGDLKSDWLREVTVSYSDTTSVGRRFPKLTPTSSELLRTTTSSPLGNSPAGEGFAMNQTGRGKAARVP